MTAINSLASGINVKLIKQLDIFKSEIKKLSPEMVAMLENSWKDQFKIPAGKLDNNSDNIYATVKVNGKVVATLYNSGAAATSNMGFGKVQNLPSMGEKEKLLGPELAQKRAEEIAKALGGKVEKASTAKTASQWQPHTIEWTYDYKKMEAAEKDCASRIETNRNTNETYNTSAQTKFNAQLSANFKN